MKKGDRSRDNINFKDAWKNIELTCYQLKLNYIFSVGACIHMKIYK